MPNNISFFAINADDVPRARKFYQAVFGWDFEPFGPPNFYVIRTGTEQVTAVAGGLQERRELLRGQKMAGFECTISVDDIDQTMRAIETNGGSIVAPKFHVPTVGIIAYFSDTEGNVAGICQEESKQ